MAPILPKGQAHTLTVGGSPRGWTFISTAACWRRWALRYLVGFFPVVVQAFFDLGSAFHALMEGKTMDEVRVLFPDHVEEAARLARIRMAGPPLGKAVAVEREYLIFGGYMTSKPDREETDVPSRPGEDVSKLPVARIRDYKTSANFSQHDEKMWGVDGGIIGEIIAGGVEEGIVDIVSKHEGKEKEPGSNPDRAPSKPVKLVKVQLTDAKSRALQIHVEGVWKGITERVIAVSKGTHPNLAFPANPQVCVGKYGPCEYYERCWGKPPESLLFKLAEHPPRRWVTGREGAKKKLPLPKGLTAKLIDQVTKIVRAAWFGPGGGF